MQSWWKKQSIGVETLNSEEEADISDIEMLAHYNQGVGGPQTLSDQCETFC